MLPWSLVSAIKTFKEETISSRLAVKFNELLSSLAKDSKSWEAFAEFANSILQKFL